LQHWDHAWCVAAALSYLGVDADSEQRQFFQDYRSTALPEAPARLRERARAADDPALTPSSTLSEEECADRTELLLAGDLEALAPLIEAPAEERKRRLDRLLSFSVSAAYVSLRDRLGLAVRVGD
jgi:hypothetical protein